MTMRPKVTLTDKPTPEAWKVLLASLVRFNQEKVGEAQPRTLAVLLSDPATDETTGGLWGRTGWGHLYIDILYIPEALRGTGLGTDLLRLAEEEAVRRGCHGAWLDTYSFQARGFYERLGYSVFGRIEDYPAGHTRFFLKKTLACSSGSLLADTRTDG